MSKQGMAREFGKTSLCGVRHVRDVGATGDKKSPDLKGYCVPQNGEPEVTRAILVYKSLYLRSPDRYSRRKRWKKKQSWTTAERPHTDLNRIEGRVMVSCS